MQKTSRRLWVLLVIGAAISAAPVASSAAKARAPATYTVVVAQMKFGPAPKSMRVGDRVEWVNNDIFLHSATAADKSFDVELKPHAHVLTTFKKPGAYPFACRYHPGMKGVIVVSAKKPRKPHGPAEGPGPIVADQRRGRNRLGQ